VIKDTLETYQFFSVMGPLKKAGAGIMNLFAKKGGAQQVARVSHPAVDPWKITGTLGTAFDQGAPIVRNTGKKMFTPKYGQLNMSPKSVIKQARKKAAAGMTAKPGKFASRYNAVQDARNMVNYQRDMTKYMSEYNEKEMISMACGGSKKKKRITLEDIERVRMFKDYASSE
jgi:hypothetical protein